MIARAPNSQSEGRKTIVLVVDPDPALRRTLSTFLPEEGFATVTAASGIEGLEIAREREPAFILYRLLEPDDLDFLKEYRGSSGRALVIVMTDYGEDKLMREAMAMGAHDQIWRPFTADELLLVLWKAEERERFRKESGV